jgi:hypothetical protein
VRTYTRTALVACGLVPAALAAVGPAAAVPNAVGSAQDVVRMLEGDGVKVVLNPVGPAPLGARPLDQCTVSAVRPGPVVAEEARGMAVESPPHTTVYVDIKC